MVDGKLEQLTNLPCSKIPQSEIQVSSAYFNSYCKIVNVRSETNLSASPNMMCPENEVIQPHQNWREKVIADFIALVSWLLHAQCMQCSDWYLPVLWELKTICPPKKCIAHCSNTQILTHPHKRFGRKEISRATP